MAETIDLSHFARSTADGVLSMDFAIEGADCAACIDDIEGSLLSLPGVESARLNVASRRLSVSWRSAVSAPQKIIECLSQAPSATLIAKRAISFIGCQLF